MSALVSGLAFASSFFTTLAGISSKRSTASSAIRFSIICEASVSDRDEIMYCWSSSSRLANTSAAISFGKILKSFNESSSSISSIMKAISTTFMSSIFFLRALYSLFRSSFSSSSLWFSSKISSTTYASFCLFI